MFGYVARVVLDAVNETGLAPPQDGQPKRVESCFLPGETWNTNDGQACTINYQPTAAYCAYHSFVPQLSGKNLIYANMPYPIYLSKTGFTCGTDVNFPGVVESPNGNRDADAAMAFDTSRGQLWSAQSARAERHDSTQTAPSASASPIRPMSTDGKPFLSLVQVAPASVDL